MTVETAAPETTELAPARACLNCDAPLVGAYCSACGQRDERQLHSIGHFMAAGFESLTHADSRFWRTIGHLVAHPGHLTREFLAGRRARYLHPVRLYLIVSVVFFLVAAIVPGDGAVVQIGPTPGAGAQAPPDRTAGSCGVLYTGPGAAWLQPRLDLGCAKARSDPDLLGSAVLHNVPRAMFVFLPLLAACLALLYWRPRRFYIEHLLLLVHGHAAVFLVMAGVLPLFAMLPPSALVDVASFLIAAYFVWYIVRSMRVVYGQSVRRTAAKAAALSLAYFMIALLTLVATLALSVATL